VGEMQAWRYRELAKDPEYYRNKINSEVSFERLIDKKREADGTKRTRQTLPADPTLDPCTRETRELVDEETGEVLTAEVRPAVEGQPERLVIADPKPVQGGCEAKEMDAVDGVVGLLADAVYAMQKTDCRGWTAANKERVAEQVGAITRLLTE